MVNQGRHLIFLGNWVPIRLVKNSLGLGKKREGGKGPLGKFFTGKEPGKGQKGLLGTNGLGITFSGLGFKWVLPRD